MSLLALLPTALSPDGPDEGSRRLWKAWSTLAGVGAGMATRTLVTKAWEARTGEPPPANPADPAVRWPQALAWSAGLGVGIGVARTVAQRGAARAWTAATGTAPPGLASVDTDGGGR